MKFFNVLVDNYWLISSETASVLSSGGGWWVCVQARNAVGWGPLSARAPLQLPRGAAPYAAAGVVAAAALAAVATAASVSLIYSKISNK